MDFLGISGPEAIIIAVVVLMFPGVKETDTYVGQKLFE